MPRVYSPKALAAAQAKYGHLGEVEQFIQQVKTDNSAIPVGDIGDLYLQLHPSLSLAQKQRVSLAVDPGAHPNPARDVATMAGAMVAAPAAVSGAGAVGLEGLGTGLAARMVGGAGGSAAGGALYDWLEKKLSGGKGPSLGNAAGDALGGAVGEGIGAGIAGGAGAVKGGLLKGAPIQGARGGLAAYLHPFNAPTAPDKSSLIDQRNLAAAEQLPPYDLNRVALQQDFNGALNTAPNIVPNVSVEGGPSRAAGLAELGTIKGNLATAEKAAAAQKAAGAAATEFQSQAPKIAAAQAKAARETGDAVSSAGTVSVPKPFTPEPAAPPIYQAPPKAAPLPRSPSPAQDSILPPEAQDIAQRRAALQAYIERNSTQPAQNPVQDSEFGAPNELGTAGEHQVPMDEKAIVRAANDPTQFRSTSRSPEVAQLHGEARGAEATPGARIKDMLEQHLEGQRMAEGTASANEVNASSAAKAQHQGAVQRYEAGRQASVASAQDAHTVADPQLQRSLRPAEVQQGVVNPNSVDGAPFDPAVLHAKILKDQQDQMAAALLKRTVSAHTSSLEAGDAVAARGLPPGYAPPSSFGEANTALARLSSRGPSPVDMDQPHMIGGLGGVEHAIKKPYFNRAIDWFSKTEPRATTDEMATPRLLDWMNRDGTLPIAAGKDTGGKGVLSDVFEPLGPTGRRGIARAVGATGSDILGQGLSHWLIGKDKERP